MGRKILRKFLWLLPGIELRKWLILLIVSVSFVSVDFIFFGMRRLSLFGFLLYLVPAIASMCYSYYRIMKYIYETLCSLDSRERDKFFPRRNFQFDPKITVIGGGTGLANLLRGIKKYSRLYDEKNLTAVVTVMDDGGSSGRIRNELNILPPGDIRNCLVSLAKEETLMSELFKYRFESHGELGGHSFGNLFIAALTNVTGDFEKAVEESSKILAVRGTILPAALSAHTLMAELCSGELVAGESAIGATPGKEITRMFLEPSGVKINHKVLKAISEADCIIFGPGSLFTSVLPNLLVPQLKATLRESAALKIYICNIMTQPSETNGFKASDHVSTIIRYLDGIHLDYAIINSQKGSADSLSRYASKGQYPVDVDRNVLNQLDTKIVLGDLMEETDYLRHNTKNLARLVVGLVTERFYEKI